MIERYPEIASPDQLCNKGTPSEQKLSAPSTIVGVLLPYHFGVLTNN